MMLFNFLVLGLSFVASSFPSVDVDSNMKSFSGAVKAGIFAPYTETVVFEYNEGPGVMTEQWFSGQNLNERTRYRIYIDEEFDARGPSIECYLFLCHGIGFTMDEENQNTPWSANRVVHNAANGGLSNRYRIPFLRNIKITLENDIETTYWYIARGVLNYPLIIGDLQFPERTRLKLYKQEDIELVPYQFITLANVSNTSGALYQVTLQAKSTDFNYLEACFRARIDHSPKFMFLSSGTEDFFLSAYYFNRGIYHDSNAGLTYFNSSGSMSAFKFFEQDPVLFTNAFELVWRCGETADGSEGCPNYYNTSQQAPPSNVKLANTLVSIYTWVYEYQL